MPMLRIHSRTIRQKWCTLAKCALCGLKAPLSYYDLVFREYLCSECVQPTLAAEGLLVINAKLENPPVSLVNLNP